LTCATARPISINVHPVQKPNDPAIVGSSLVLDTTPPGKVPRIVVLAQLDRDGAAKLSYDPDVCS
jgi:hypothetical protein